MHLHPFPPVEEGGQGVWGKENFLQCIALLMRLIEVYEQYLYASSSAECIQDQQENHGADDGHHERSPESGSRADIQQIKQQSADECADDADSDVPDESEPVAADDFTRNPSCYRADEEKPEYFHSKKGKEVPLMTGGGAAYDGESSDQLIAVSG